MGELTESLCAFGCLPGDHWQVWWSEKDSIVICDCTAVGVNCMQVNCRATRYIRPRD